MEFEPIKSADQVFCQTKIVYTMQDQQGNDIAFINDGATIPSATSHIDQYVDGALDNQSFDYTFTAVLFGHSLTYQVLYDIIWCTFETEHTQEEALADL